MRFRTTILKTGKNITGIEVPEKILSSLGGGKRPLVKATINGYTYRSAVGSRGNRYLLGISADVRAAAKISGGDEVDVNLELDTAPREVTVPPALAKVLATAPNLKSVFDGLSNSKKKLHTLPIENAKTDETRDRNVQKALASLRTTRDIVRKENRKKDVA
jgi:hypothetical protein